MVEPEREIGARDAGETGSECLRHADSKRRFSAYLRTRLDLLRAPRADEQEYRSDNKANALDKYIVVVGKRAEDIHYAPVVPDGDEQKQQWHAGDNEHKEHTPVFVHLAPLELAGKNVFYRGEKLDYKTPYCLIINNEHRYQSAHM